MAPGWHSLYIADVSPEAVSAALISVLGKHGYTPYDPFPGGAGTPPGLTDLVRLFVAPPQEGWVRVLGALDRALCTELSAALDRPVLVAWLDESSGGLALATGDAFRETPDALVPYLRTGSALDDLRRAWAGEVRSDPLPDESQAEQGLPPALRDMAEQQGVDPRKAGSLFEQLSGRLFGGLAGQAGESSAEQEAARAVLMGGGRNPWNSLAGARVRAIASLLTLPANWREPDWDAVRDAYQAHRMRERYPRMTPLPGDRAALAAVPDAAAYRPVFMGRARAEG
ncbi:MAG: hypothetical protein KatS3mg051_0826 [Anaerolineae bacterium]|nr:MAG: hypothetical protein KatS3mg051_0826 [Anaerolineae bacterium]